MRQQLRLEKQKEWLSEKEFGEYVTSVNDVALSIVEYCHIEEACDDV